LVSPRLPALAWRMKYFCAWLATCVGVRVFTDHREMLRQSPRPYFSSPSRNSLRGETKIQPGLPHLYEPGREFR
jgi:hypothetical protein